ncbi:TPA: methylenetetrahydrofolate--tRNA-(uracil(54)-C(5))-methyltransferase (FADH(2)-oxidizing) TrmFO [Candidatus Galligastranaerophilus faecipullorum]|nr:methylenetetrahydrofolate--tRNA-(uracil(54)-C(5))-methyltransferase (FADH(2)-oxidizing) TrmFO [Candidatus Galligastranaerophilus faecipullorum]
MSVIVAGGGLAGSEAALYLADRGIEVLLYEMRPDKSTGAHTGSDFAEFVCSNSLGSTGTSSASGLLKEEALLFGSTLMKTAFDTRVPSGNSLSIDRHGFSAKITDLINNHPNIKVVREEIVKIPQNTPAIIATGPLTSDTLCNDIKSLTGEENFHFYDAIAPIVKKESVNFEKAFYASRWNKGEADFINCPLNKEEYENFYSIISTAQRAELKSFEAKYFEGCMPVEVLASRGKDTLRFGPMKPVGLFDERTRKPEHKNYQFYAVVQLRQDDKEADLYNLVGFQTNLKWGEQKRLINAIPGLEEAQIVRYGVMHANTFINSPKILNKTLQVKNRPDLFFAGQITGVEGYSESITTGLFAAINMYRLLKGEKPIELKPVCMLGALIDYITFEGHKSFQPVNSNWGIIQKPENFKISKKNKEEKSAVLSDIALEYTKEIRNGYFC